jgi:Domain of Unknown Function (DUF1080)
MNSTHSLLRLIALLVVLGGSTARAATAPAVTDPTQAGPDFLLQGEYEGQIDDVRLGVQVIAQGKGEFYSVAYHGGLPGDGWDGNTSTLVCGAGHAADGVLTLTSGAYAATVKAGDITITEGGQPLGTLHRVQRQSPTLGATAPKGAVVLFDGSKTDAWKNGRSENGLLLQGVTSLASFGSFSLHLEFRTPFMPEARGQGRGNSGFYAQGRYEVQVLDSFGLKGEDNECGGIYKVGRPRVNMCLPPLQWQTYDVDFTAASYDASQKKTANARITVKHNGVIIHENLEIPGATTSAPLPEGPTPGPIYLQDHGNPVRFRNVWLLAK